MSLLLTVRFVNWGSLGLLRFQAGCYDAKQESRYPAYQPLRPSASLRVDRMSEQTLVPRGVFSASNKRLTSSGLLILRSRCFSLRPAFWRVGKWASYSAFQLEKSATLWRTRRYVIALYFV